MRINLPAGGSDGCCVVEGHPVLLHVWRWFSFKTPVSVTDNKPPGFEVQFDPPNNGKGLSQNLILDWVPPLQDDEHVSQWLQSPQLPSTWIMNIYFSSSDTRNCHISSVTEMYKQSKNIHYQDIPACYNFLVLLRLLHRLRHLPLPPFLFLFVFYYLSHMYLNNHLFATGSIHSQWLQLNL